MGALYDIVPSCARELEDEKSIRELSSAFTVCNRRKLSDEISESGFTREFVGTKIYADAVSALEFYAQPRQMRMCKEKFEADIYNDINSISDKVRECKHSHESSDEWMKYRESQGYVAIF